MIGADTDPEYRIDASLIIRYLTTLHTTQIINTYNTSYNTNHKHLQDPLLTVNIITFSSLLLYVHYHEQPVCTSLLFTLLFIKSQYTVFSFFVLIVILLFFAHLFCTSYCLLHILLFFAHLIVLHFFISLHILLLFLLFLPYVCPCVMLLYIICIIILHCPLSGPDSITFHF